MIILKSIYVLLTFLWHVTNCQPDDETSIISNEENTGTTQAYAYDDYYDYQENVPSKADYFSNTENVETVVDNSTVVRIVGGILASQHEFPWMAALVYENKNGYELIFCGGSIISPNSILTAAHCLESIKYNGKSLIDTLHFKMNF